MPRPKPRFRHLAQCGFTLLEVLIALAVLAIGMAAVIGTAGTSTRAAGELRDRTFAHWVAMNEMTELRIADAWQPGSSQSGEADLGGEHWKWKAKLSTTADPDLLRVDIDVSNALTPDVVISSLIGFYGRGSAPISLPSPQRNNPAPTP